MDEQVEGLVGGVIAAMAGLFMFVMMALLVLILAGMWKVFTKAGKPGWACLVPIYNAIVLLRIVGRPDIWVLFFLIPGVNFVIQIIVLIDLAKSFGKDVLFGVGMIFLPIVFLPVLGFGKAAYVGPSAALAAAGPGVSPPPPAPSAYT